MWGSKWRSFWLPRTSSDSIAFLFVSAIIPAIYIFETCIVFPTIYHDNPFLIYFHSIFGTYLLINLVGNLMGVVLVDTSIKGLILSPSQADPDQGWRYCSDCETITPPRSWHCERCKTCILCREHHCAFTGYCVGHRNRRYFMCFIFYMWLCTAYCTYFNHGFIMNSLGTFTWKHIVRLVMPMAVILLGFDFSATQFYTFFYTVSIIGFLFTSTLLYIHIKLTWKGITTYENNQKVARYDLGPYQNFKEVFGEKWFLAALFPFCNSPLPHDGVHFHTREEWQLEGSKHK